MGKPKQGKLKKTEEASTEAQEAVFETFTELNYDYLYSQDSSPDTEEAEGNDLSITFLHLRLIAVELVKIIRQNSGVDWTLRKTSRQK